MQQPIRRQHGFTLIEILLVIGVIGILGAIATVGYQEYQSRARAADILVKYDAIRSGIGSQVAGGVAPDCAEQAKGFSTANLNDEYANLSYGFQPAAGGFRPVLTVCARADTTGKLGVKVAKGAMDTLVKTGSVEPGSLVSDSVVSFALPLTAGNKATCTVYQPAAAQPACAGPGAAAAAAAAGTPVASAAATTASTPAPVVTTASAPTLPPQAPASAPVAQPSTTGTPQPAPCRDDFLGDCVVDFTGMCDMDFVREQCQKTCGVCQSAPAPANTAPVATAPAASAPAPAASLPLAQQVPQFSPPAATGAHIVYSTQTSVERDDGYWLSQMGARSGDGSSTTIVSMTADPAFAKITGGPGNWRITFARPGVTGRGTIMVTLRNGAGTSTGAFIVGTGQ